MVIAQKQNASTAASDNNLPGEGWEETKEYVCYFVQLELTCI
jgi:hypothetical protein